MPTAPTKLQRWLDLVAFLAARHFPVPTEELWEAVPAYTRGLEGEEKSKAAVRRMFERDKDELRALGIPIEAVPVRIGMEEESFGYRLARADFHLPYLKLVEEARGTAGSSAADRASPAPAARRAPSPAPGAFELVREEAAAALEGLRELATLPGFPLARSARSAFRKLAFDLDPELLGDAPVVWVEDPEVTATTDLLGPLSEALLARKGVTFDYRAMHADAEARRTAWPYGLLFQHGRWYLVAEDADKREIRMFRVGRMSALEVNRKTPGTPDYAIPDDFDLEGYGGRSAWELGEDPDGGVDATVLFRFPRSFWAHRNDHGTLVEERADGSHLRRFRIRRRDPFLRWLLSLGGDAVVVEPEDLREAFHAMARAVVERYRDDAPEDAGDDGSDDASEDASEDAPADDEEAADA